MTNTSKTKSIAKKVSLASENHDPSMSVNGTVLALNDNALRAVAIFAATQMFSQPQFAAQTNPTNIIGLADLLYKYMQNQMVVNQPAEASASATFA